MQVLCLCLITDSKVSLRHWSGNHYAGTHFCKIGEIQADGKLFPTLDRKRNSITFDSFPCRNCHGSISVELQRHYGVRNNAVCTV